MEENNKQIEKELSGHRTKAALAKIVTYGAGIIAVIFFIKNITVAAVAFLIIAIVGAYQLSKQQEELKKTLGDGVVTDTVKEVFDTPEYNAFGYISADTVYNSGILFPFDYEIVRGSEYIKAHYKGMNVELGSVELYHVDEVFNQERNEAEKTEKNIFTGQWMVCDLGRPLSGDIHISENNRQIRKEHKDKVVETNNAEFDSRFVVIADNANEAAGILTSKVTDYILSAAKNSGGDVYMSFLRDGKLHIAVKTEKGLFDIGSGKTDVNTLHNKFVDRLHCFTGIIDEISY